MVMFLYKVSSTHDDLFPLVDRYQVLHWALPGSIRKRVNCDPVIFIVKVHMSHDQRLFLSY